MLGLEALLELGRKKIVVQSDWQLLVRQLNGEYRVKDEKLRVLHQRALALLRQFASYRILLVRREMNKWADGWPIETSTTRQNEKPRAKVDLAIALRDRTRGEESPDSAGQGGR
jgi:hypothetical protein